MSDITWRNDTATLGELVPWERNPKRISKTHAKRLLDYWHKIGQFQTVAIGPNGEVYDGHQRLSVLLAAHGKDYTLDVRRASRPLTDEERQELVIAAHVGTTGSFDWDELSGWDAEALQGWGMDAELLADWRTDIVGLDTMLKAEQEPQEDDPGAQVDKAAELQAKWQTATGQLWQLGEHRLICGDCTDAAVVERVMGGERADLLLSDPPYGKLKIFNSSGAVGNAGNNLAKVRNYGAYHDHATFQLEPMLKALEGFYDKAIIWGGNNFTDILPVTQSWLVWDKRAGKQLFYADCELAWSDLGITAKVFDFVWQGMIREGDPVERMHPTQKPVQLYEWCLGLADKAITVLDPTLGSASTLIACERLGRRCRAVEIEPGYVAVALERWATMTGGVPVLLENYSNGEQEPVT